MSNGATKREAAKHLRSAAKLIEKHGWLQGRSGTYKHGFCIVGALCESMGFKEYSNRCLALAALRDVVRDAGGGAGIVDFNDARGRTKEEVLRAMRKAARNLEHGWNP